MDKKTKLNKTKSTKQKLDSSSSAGGVYVFVFFSALFGLLFTGIPSYVPLYMHIYLIFTVVDLVVGIVIVKTRKVVLGKDIVVAKYILFQVYFAGIWAVLDAWRVVNFQIGLGIVYWGTFLSAFVIGKLFGLQIGTAIVFPERASKKAVNITTIIIGAAGLLSVGGYCMIRMVNFLDPHSANAILSVTMLLVTSLITLIFFSFSSGGKKKKRLEQQHLSST